MASVNTDRPLQTVHHMPVSGPSHLANTLIMSFSSRMTLMGLCTFPRVLTILSSSWYHSHMGTQTLTCHGAIVVAAKCANPADCPCTHVNSGRPGDQVWDPIAGDWSPTVGIDFTVNIEIDWNGGSVSLSDSTHVSIGYDNGGNSNGNNGGQGS